MPFLPFGKKSLISIVRPTAFPFSFYAKEAAAMVDTWRSSWFGESGTRLLYLVPSRLTHELLPLTIEPRPDETIRVLVGRMEILTPEHRDEIAHAVRGMGTCAAVSAEPLRSELTHLGRFTEPALESLLSHDPDPSWNSVVKTLVSQARIAH